MKHYIWDVVYKVPRGYPLTKCFITHVFLVVVLYVSEMSSGACGEANGPTLDVA